MNRSYVLGPLNVLHGRHSKHTWFTVSPTRYDGRVNGVSISFGHRFGALYWFTRRKL